jgi:hypothetical protein
MAGRIPIADPPIKTIDDYRADKAAGKLSGPYDAVDIEPLRFTHSDLQDALRKEAGAVAGARLEETFVTKLNEIAAEQKRTNTVRTLDIDSIARVNGLLAVRPPEDETRPGGVIRVPDHQPPILREEFTATRVEMHRDADDQPQALGVTMTLHRVPRNAPGTLSERGLHVSKLDLHLPLEYAGQFHAGQKFWLTIAPAVEGD